MIAHLDGHELIEGYRGMVTRYDSPKSSHPTFYGISRVRLEVLTSETTRVSLTPGNVYVVFCELGSCLVRSASSHTVSLMHPGSISLIRGNQVAIRAMKGSHEFTLMSAHLRPDQATFQELCTMPPILSSSDHTGLHEVDWELLSRLTESTPNFFDVCKTFYDALGFLHRRQNRIDVAQLPDSVPQVFRVLCDRVTGSLQEDWNVSRAALECGYSVHHFSRTFKQCVGYGFQSFVERSRTNLAVKECCSARQLTEVAAKNCGFHTAQAMRDAFRDYLGVLPSDIRSVFPEETKAAR